MYWAASLNNRKTNLASFAKTISSLCTKCCPRWQNKMSAKACSVDRSRTAVLSGYRCTEELHHTKHLLDCKRHRWVIVERVYLREQSTADRSLFQCPVFNSASTHGPRTSWKFFDAIWQFYDVLASLKKCCQQKASTFSNIFSRNYSTGDPTPVPYLKLTS